MSAAVAYWVRYSEEMKNWCAGVGQQALFMGFSDEEAAWTWMRQHLLDKYEAVLRQEDRRELLTQQLKNEREMLLASLLEPRRVQ
jgi:hypothetical protein